MPRKPTIVIEPSKTPPAPQVPDIKSRILDIANRWADKHLTPHALEAEVHQFLHETRRQNLLKILGFRHDTYSNRNLEIDTCNGRDGRSFFGPPFHEAAKAAANEILMQLITATPIQLTEDELRRLRQTYRKTYMGALNQQVYEAANKRAKLDFQSFIVELQAQNPVLSLLYPVSKE